MQIPAEPVGLHLRGRCPDPALGAPGSQAVVLARPGGLHEGAEERVDPEAMGEVAASSVALVRNPGKVRGSDALRIGDLAQAGLREKPTRGWPSFCEASPRRERCEELQILQLPQPVLAPPDGAEE